MEAKHRSQTRLGLMAERTATILNLIVILQRQYAVFDRLHTLQIHERSSQHHQRPQAPPHSGAEYVTGISADSTTKVQTYTIALSPIEKPAAFEHPDHYPGANARYADVEFHHRQQ